MYTNAFFGMVPYIERDIKACAKTLSNVQVLVMIKRNSLFHCPTGWSLLLLEVPTMAKLNQILNEKEVKCHCFKKPTYAYTIPMFFILSYLSAQLLLMFTFAGWLGFINSWHSFLFNYRARCFPLILIVCICDSIFYFQTFCYLIYIFLITNGIRVVYDFIPFFPPVIAFS